LQSYKRSLKIKKPKSNSNLISKAKYIYIMYRRYKKEEQRFLTKSSMIQSNLDEIRNIEKIFEELLSFIDTNIDSKILQKANDVTTFLHKSFTDLDIITKN